MPWFFHVGSSPDEDKSECNVYVAGSVVCVGVKPVLITGR